MKILKIGEAYVPISDRHYDRSTQVGRLQAMILDHLKKYHENFLGEEPQDA